MKLFIKYAWLLIMFCTFNLKAQQQGYDIFLPPPSQPNQIIHTGDYEAQDEIDIKPVGMQEVHLTPQVVGTDKVHLFIDPTLVLDIPYSSNSTSGSTPPNSDITRTLDFTLPVGSTPSTYNVNMFGALNYNIPIVCAPGTKGIEPKISINYNSLGRHGLVGYGWDISGLQSVSRTGKTFYHNSDVTSVTLTNSDWFTYNGNKLDVVGGVWDTDNGLNGTKYQTESETFTRVTSVGTIGNGPQSFYVETKEGLEIQFGYTSDSRLIPDGQNTVLTWMINKITDNYGNYMTFSYHNANGEVYIDEINYTGNANIFSSTTTPPYNKMKFYYDTRQDQKMAYVGNGSEPSGKLNSTIILREIEVFAETISFKKYDFNYYFNNGFSYLNEVIEHGADGTKYNSILFSYQDDDNASAPLQQTATIANRSTRFNVFTALDVNQDGSDDLISLNYDYANSINWFDWDILKNLGNSQFSRTNHTAFLNQNFFPLDFYPMDKTSLGNTTFDVVDFDGDGKEDIVFAGSGGTTIGIDAYLSGNSFGLSSTSLTGLLGGSDKNLMYVDLNGDQKLDVVNFYVLSTKTYIQVWFDLNSTPVNTVFYDVYNVGQTIAADVDGDGKSEVINFMGPATTASPYGRYYLTFDNVGLLLSLKPDLSGQNLGENVYVPYQSGGSHNFCPYNSFLNFLGDFNGDSKTDVLYCLQPGSSSPSPATWSLHIGKGDATYENISSFSAPFTDPFANCGFRHLTRDFNADGKTDILEYNSTSPGASLDFNIYYSQGISFIKETFSVNLSFNDYAIGFGDFNGDGSQDLFFYSINQLGIDPVIVYLYKGVKSKLMKEIVNGLNLKLQFEFNPIGSTGVYTQTSVANYPLNSANGAFYVTTKVTKPDGVSGDNIISYTYEDLIIHKTGKGLIGFLKTKEFNNSTNFQTVNEYDYDPAFFNLFPKKKSTNLIAGSSTLLEQTDYTVNTIGVTGIRYFSSVTNIFSKDFISGKTSKVDLGYDNFGNILSKTVNINSGYDITTTTTTYVQDGAWIPSKPSSIITAVSRNGSTYTRAIDYSYNQLHMGEVSSVKFDNAQLILNGNNKKEVNIDYTYDSFGTGVLLKKKVSSIDASGLPVITDTYQYDANFRYPIVQTNSKNQSVQNTYDPRWGKVLTATGVDNLTSKLTYDPYGKQISLKTPDNLTELTSYDWIAAGEISGDPSLQNYSPLNLLYKITNSKQGNPTIINYLDLYGRTGRIKTDGFIKPLYQIMSYDEKGNVVGTASNYEIGTGTSYVPILSTYQYNSLSQCTTIVQTDNNITNPTYIAYSYNTSIGASIVATTNPDGKTFTTITDATGLLISSNDNSVNTTTYEYGSKRKPETIKINGSPVATITYDDYGRQKTLQEVNSGTTNYEYNGYGQLYSETDAKGQNYIKTYDVLGRIKDITGSGGDNYSYSYVQSGNGINLLQTVNGPNSTSCNYSYDGLNHLTQMQENNGATPLITTYQYDQFGNVSKMIYPSGFAINKTYTSNSFPASITRADNGHLIWQANSMNPLGQIDNTSLGDGNTIKKHFTNFGLPTSYDGGTSVPRFDFNFDPTNGNLMSRTDYFSGNTGTSLTETFSYTDNGDKLDRLTSINGPNGVISMKYKPNGNIDTKSDVGSYSYNNVKLNAVEVVSNPDALISTNLQTIQYSPFNKVNYIGENSNELTITYGANQQRAQADLVNNNTGPVSTMYYGNNYEKEVKGSSITEVHYINGGDGLCALYVITNGVGKMYYVYKDHLGSILTLTDDQGQIVARQSFDAWGRSRNANDWTYNPQTSLATPSWLHRGFTGHEHLLSFSLINMNGRMYDPILCRMLSPDNSMGDATNSQLFNRYSYCLNNPLKYNDPTGEDLGWDDLIVFGVGFIVGDIGYASTHRTGTGFKNFLHDATSDKALKSGLITGAEAELGYLTLGGGSDLLGAGGGDVAFNTVETGSAYALDFAVSDASNLYSNQDQLSKAQGRDGVLLVAGYGGAAALEAGFGSEYGEAFIDDQIEYATSYTYLEFLDPADYKLTGGVASHFIGGAANEGINKALDQYKPETRSWETNYNDIGRAALFGGLGGIADKGAENAFGLIKGNGFWKSSSRFAGKAIVGNEASAILGSLGDKQPWSSQLLSPSTGIGIAGSVLSGILDLMK